MINNPEQKDSNVSSNIIEAYPSEIINKANIPELILPGILESCKTNNGTADIVRNFPKNFDIDEVSEEILLQTGLSGEDLLNILRQELSSMTSGNLENVVYFKDEGDKLLPSDVGDAVEFIKVKSTKVDNKDAEATLVRMWRFGAIKQLFFPSGESDDKLKYEIFLCLKNKMNIIIPEEVNEKENGLVTGDTFTNIELNVGDIAILPSTTTRQILNSRPTNSLTQDSVAYLTISPPWGTPDGLATKKVSYSE